MAEEKPHKGFYREEILKDYALASRDLNVEDPTFIKEFPDVVPIIVNDLEENPRKTTYHGHKEGQKPVNTSSGIQFNTERQRQPNSETQPAAKIIKVGSPNLRDPDRDPNIFPGQPPIPGSQSRMAVVRQRESMEISTSDTKPENNQTTSTFRKLHSKIPLEENDESFVKGKIGRTSFRK